MTRREQLQDSYEDQLFALLMEDFARQEDQTLREEAQQLREDPEAAVSSALDARCRRLIRRGFAGQTWRRRGYAAYRVFQYAASFLLMLSVLFGAAYAAFPEVRTGVLNLIIETGDVATRLSLDGTSGGADYDGVITTDAEGRKVLLGYRLPEAPEGFEIDFEDYNDVSAFVEYIDSDERTIQVSVDPAEGAGMYVDTENAQNVEKIQIHGFEGMLIEKGDRVTVIWADTERLQFVTVICTGIEKEFVLNYANEITFEGVIP